MKSRVCRVLVSLGVGCLVAAIFVLGCDAVQVIHWSGSRDIELTVNAPHPVRSVSYVCWWKGEADYYRDLIAEHGIRIVRAVESTPKPAERQPDGTYTIMVRTGGKESNLKMLHNSYYQQEDALILVELETGEQWATILTLPDVTKTTQIIVRIPDDARQLPPAPMGELGGK